MTMPDWIPGAEPPTDAEIVLAYWKAQAEHWARAHHDRLSTYDALTARLERLYGTEWGRCIDEAIAHGETRAKRGKENL